MGTKLSIGNDHAGHDLAMSLIRWLEEEDREIFYYGTFSKYDSVDYPDYAVRVAQDVASGKGNYGILVCKSGTGMCIAANKVEDVRAANCWEPEVARLARAHNDANVLCIGSNFVDPKKARDIVNMFLQTEFEVRHSKRIEKISMLER
jgi:ribose 5-phosphate isomerase B